MEEYEEDVPHIIIVKYYSRICSILVKSKKISRLIKDSLNNYFRR